MEKVTAVVYLSNGQKVSINSNKAKYNDDNNDTSFNGSVKMIYNEHIINAENLNLSFKNQTATLYDNVKYESSLSNLIADKIFINSGFEWREPGCSMCLAMNADKLNPQERCASTSNRNFEGRQGRGGRTHLVSPAMAVAAAIKGHLADVREI